MVNKLIKDGIIEEVHDQTTEWVSPAFFVPKPNGKLRLVTDFTHLNKAIKRPVHPFPSAREIVQDIPAGTGYFLKFDALQGYHQVALHKDSRHLTTFLLPMGKYRYKRGPMGLMSTSDVYCAKSDRTIEDVKDSRKIVDDILLWAKTKETLCSQARQVLSNCREHGVTLARKKIAFGTALDFAGFHLNQTGIQPEREKLKALKDFPTPKNITDVKCFLVVVGPAKVPFLFQ